MAKLSRREFLRLAAVGAGALASSEILAACGQADTPPPPTNTSAPPTSTVTAPPVGTMMPYKEWTPTAMETGESAATATEPPPTATEALPPELVVVRGGEPEALVRAAIGALGGMQTFVKSGNTVVVKPNICVDYHTYEYAATTNPWVVGALVKLCLEAGAGKVMVMDYPFGGTVDEAYKKTGIREQVEAAGGEMAFMPGYKYVETDIPDGKDLKKFWVFSEALNADVLINVPIAKTHDLSKLTLGMKNLMGVIRDRQMMHANIGQRLADVASRLRPALTVVDAVRILTAHGPTGGNLKDVKKLDTVIASPDIVAADSYAATLFGMQPSDLSFVVAGAAMGLGKMDLASLRIQEINGAS